MLNRRYFLAASAAGLLSACQSTTQSAALMQRRDSVYGDMKVLDVEIVLNPGMRRQFNYAGLSSNRVHKTLAAKVRSALNDAHPMGTRPAKVVVKLSAISIAQKGVRAAAYDSVIIAHARFFDQETNEQIGGAWRASNLSPALFERTGQGTYT